MLSCSDTQPDSCVKHSKVAVKSNSALLAGRKPVMYPAFGCPYACKPREMGRRPVVCQGIKVAPSGTFRWLMLRSGQCGVASAVHLVHIWVGGREEDQTLLFGRNEVGSDASGQQQDQRRVLGEGQQCCVRCRTHTCSHFSSCGMHPWVPM